MHVTTVGELIELLKELPPETKFEVRDVDGNFTLGADVCRSPGRDSVLIGTGFWPG
jgi:hypothetical protein